MARTKLGDDLRNAAANGDVAACRAIIDRGACVTEADDDGWTALNSAVAYGRSPEVCALLIEHGADWRAKAEVMFYRLTPMQQAVFSGHVAIVDYFVTVHGEDLDQLTDDGKTLEELSQAFQSNDETLIYLMARRSEATSIAIDASIDGQAENLEVVAPRSRAQAPSL